MEANNSESKSIESSESFLNKPFVKGLLAGFVFGLGILISDMIWDLLEPYEFESIATHQVLPVAIVYVVMPLLIICLLGMVVRFALGRYGFEGWIGGKMTVTHLVGAFLGFFITPFIVWIFMEVILAFSGIGG